jgi:hypothetical protein
MEAISSSESSGYLPIIRRYSPEDRSIRSHCRENFKSCMKSYVLEAEAHYEIHMIKQKYVESGKFHNKTIQTPYTWKRKHTNTFMWILMLEADYN